ncbi:carbohydrate binding domain-containing protein [Aestuariivivens sediminicola]|uniref:carbohydrate binding domain-containing protein n=1 Tax=Aestuariivivens sediminicola TaxID=2913560 RepID=UPI001F5ABC04|nr:carbohydrate binding domain-containing protein [Aestuariivivens sediminicola]
MKNNYFKLLILVIMSFTLSVSQSQNILYDGDFSQTTEIIPFDTPSPPLNVWAYWVNYNGNGSDASPIVVDGVCNFHIINPGDAAWNVQLAQWGFPLIQGHSYQLSFDVRADSNRSFGVYLGEDGGNWTTLIGFDRYLYYATTEWQTIHIEFEAYTVFPLHKLSFDLGVDSTTTYFDNIVLTDLGPGEPKLNLMNMPPSGSTADAGPEDLNGDLEYSVSNFIVGEPGTGTEGDGYISWSITNITDGGTLHDSGSIYDLSVAASFITLLPNKTYYLSSFLVDNDGAPLGNPESAYNLTVNTFGYNAVADITALRAHVAAHGEGLYYEITGASLVNQRNDFHNRLWLQDSHISGLMIVDIDAVIATHFSIGDKVTGFKGQARYLNDSKITLIPSVDSGVLESSGNPVNPQVVTISDFNSNFLNYESEIIELHDVTIAEGNGFEVFNPGSIYHVTDANMNTVLMYIDYWNADYIGTVIPNATLSSLTAVAGHFGGVAQIYPRSLSDFSTGSSDLLYDGDFSLTTEIIPIDQFSPTLNVWSYWVNNGQTANPTMVNGVCNFQISNAGNDTYDVQLGQWGLPLTEGHTYELSFDVKSDAQRSFGVFVGENGGNWTNLISSQYLYDSYSDWQTVKIIFVAYSVFDINKLSFELGTSDITIYFDNVVLKDLGMESQSILYDGDFNQTTEIIPYNTPPPPLNMWTFWTNWVSNAEAYPIISNGVCNFQITNSGFNTWDVQLVQWGFPLEQGHSYQLSFDVRADYNRSFGVYLGEEGGNWTNLIGFDRYLYSATTEWQTISIDFDAFLVFPLHKLSFELGTNNASTYFDNIVLIDLGVQEHSIGILGSAVNGWYEDVDMASSDGINYSLTNFPLEEGELKFRQDNDWTVNWGGYAFPTGIGWQNGPNIPVLKGTYDITFNRLSGQYDFMAITCPIPELQCPSDIYLENIAGLCGAYVDFPEISPPVNCGGEITLEQTSGLPSGSFFPVGTTTNSFVLTNATGDTATCSFNVTVFDNEPPVISDLEETYKPLWPPNHKMVPVFIPYMTSDNCNIATTELYISSNEPVNGLGDGDKEPDWDIVDEHNVLLRAERSGNGNGREYYITIRVFDDSWNYTERQITISVLHDKGKITQRFIPSETITNTFILYPNGADEIINIKGPLSPSGSNYSIYNMFGVSKRHGTIKNNQINVKTLPQGLYVLGFETDHGYCYKKFIKK